MTETWGPEQIREYWRSQALAHGAQPAASWTDVRVMELEIDAISERLPDSGRVLDIGCANGWSTLRLAARRRAFFRGIDYIPEMVDAARTQLDLSSHALLGEVEFATGNALALAEPDDSCDAVVSIRVMINLGQWSEQIRGLREAVRVLRPGGVFLLSEATLQGWRRLNALRREWGLDDIPMPSFNNYLDEDAVEDALSDACDLVEKANFASTYFVATRLVKPLVAAATSAPIDVADPLSEWNRFWAAAPAFGDYGTQKLLVFRKR